MNARNRTAGFSLMEVILAMGIFLVAILALVGLLGPALKQVDQVIDTDEVASVVNTVNTFLQRSPDIANPSGTQSAFEEIFKAVQSQGYAAVYVFKYYNSNDEYDTLILQEVGFAPGTLSHAEADFDTGALDRATGTVYRVILSASPVTPVEYRSGGRAPGSRIFTLASDYENYEEGYLALEARIFPEDPPGPTTANRAQLLEVDLAELGERESLFTYNVAVVR